MNMTAAYPPEMEDFLQFSVDSIQEDVRPGGPVFVHGWHRWHVFLQVQEIFLHLSKQTGTSEGCAGRNGMFAIIPANIWWKSTRQRTFLLPQTPLRSANTHDSLDGEVIDLPARVGSEEFSVLPADLLQPEKTNKNSDYLLPLFSNGAKTRMGC